MRLFSITTLCAFYPNRGDSQVVQKGALMAAAWMDRKVVMVMSTNTQPSAQGSIPRRERDHSRTPIPCPESIIKYNKYMGGVDLGDQLRGYYSCRTKSRKFYKYIFHFLLDVSITNAFILQRNFCPDPPYKTIKDFRLQLARELIGDYCSRQRAGRKSSDSVIRPLPLRHFPVRILNESQGVKHKRGRCTYCTETRHQRSDSTWYCRECEVWLCHSGTPSCDCFLQWHARRKGTL